MNRRTLFSLLFAAPLAATKLSSLGSGAPAAPQAPLGFDIARARFDAATFPGLRPTTLWERLYMLEHAKDEADRQHLARIVLEAWE